MDASTPQHPGRSMSFPRTSRLTRFTPDSLNTPVRPVARNTWTGDVFRFMRRLGLPLQQNEPSSTPAPLAVPDTDASMGRRCRSRSIAEVTTTRTRRTTTSVQYFNRLSPHPGHRLYASTQNEETSWTSLQTHWNRAFANWNSSKTEKPDPTTPLGFSFSPAGLLLPYHLGVAECLRHFNYLTSSVPIAGASAGALAVASVTCDVPAETAMRIVYSVEEDLRAHGAARRLHSILQSQLDLLLPEDAHRYFNERPGKSTVSFTKVWPFMKGCFASEFTSKEDLKECLIASCNIPFYFSKWPTVTCRGRPCVDGYFAVSRRHFGCPPVDAKRNVHILPFSPKAVHVSFPEGNCISPDLQTFDELLTEASEGQFVVDLLKYLTEYPVPSPPSATPDPETTSDPQIILEPQTTVDPQPNPQLTPDPQITPEPQPTPDPQPNPQLTPDPQTFPTSSNILETEIPRLVEEAVLPDGSVACPNPVTPAPPDDLQIKDGVIESAENPTAVHPGLVLKDPSEEQREHDSAVGLARLGRMWGVLDPTGFFSRAEELPPPSLSVLPTLRYSVQELLRFALDATRDEVAAELYDMGRADAFRWIRLEQMQQRAPSQDPSVVDCDTQGEGGDSQDSRFVQDELLDAQMERKVTSPDGESK